MNAQLRKIVDQMDDVLGIAARGSHGIAPGAVQHWRDNIAALAAPGDADVVLLECADDLRSVAREVEHNKYRGTPREEWPRLDERIARIRVGEAALRRLAAPSKETGALDELTREQERLGLYAVPQADQQGCVTHWPVGYCEACDGPCRGAKPSDQQGASTAPVDRADYAVALATIESLRLRLGGCERALADRDEQLAALASKDQQGASLEGDVGRLAAAVLWAREEWADKEHVARCRGDIPLADYYGRCKDSMNAALASKASPDDQRQEVTIHALGTGLHASEASPPTEAAAAVGDGYMGEVLARLAQAVRERVGSTVLISKADACAIGAALSPTASAAREGL